MLRVLILTGNLVLVSQIEEVGADIGEPDCKLVEPFVLEIDSNNITLSPWLMQYTNENSYMISSEKIITLVKPKGIIEEKYWSLVK